MELSKADHENLLKLLDRVRDINGIDDARVISVLAAKLEYAIEHPASTEPVEEPNDNVPTDN